MNDFKKTTPALTSKNLPLISWATYDFGSSAFAAIIQTFVFPAYFVNKIATDPVEGAALWGFIASLSALAVALICPFIGAAADQGGGRKIWLATFTIAACLCTALLWFVHPSSNSVILALILVGIGTVGAEGAYVFYNAMLPELAAPSEIGRWSGWGWGMGYIGGTVALIICLIIIDGDEIPTFLNIVKNGEADAVLRSTFVFAALWVALFSIPLFLLTPSSPPRKKTLTQAMKSGACQVVTTIREVKKYQPIVRFLIAKIFYIDGLATLFAFGGIYAASVFAMSEKEVLQFGISLNISAGVGAFLFARLDDRIGSKRMILFSLIGLIIPGVCALIVTYKWQFWIFALILGIFIGPVQSSSRAFMARITPSHLRNQMFGFYMFSGKATAFLGPMLYGWTAYLTQSIRWGMGSVIFLFFIGWLLMLTVSEKQK